MAKIINPFIVTGKIAPEYFCDRVSESARLVKSVTNGNNLVVISPRRMGKTGLIQFCYDKPEIGKEYYTFFIDILHTSSLREFTYLLGREIYETLLPRSRKMATLFIQTIKSISGKFGFDPISNLPTFNVELGDIERPEYTLDEIFQYLSLIKFLSTQVEDKSILLNMRIFNIYNYLRDLQLKTGDIPYRRKALFLFYKYSLFNFFPKYILRLLKLYTK